ncbi:MAG: sigma-70 family RNA polymerase sigma factor [Verrucomicrobia bacterium]|nr:sigma-70 family RNA polymerase sigma factor [Verrucomicrobiota bacterium]
MASDFQNISDEELARQTQAGSLVAFEELVYRYEGRVYGFVANCCRPGADARDVTQDTFVRAFQAIAQFDPRRGFAAWLFTIARRKCVDHYRAAPPVAAEESAPDLPDENDPSELLARQEERQSLWELARRRLPEAQFHALWLRYAEDMSVEAIAQVLHKTRIHVKVLLFRARQALGRELKVGRVPCVSPKLASSRSSPDLEDELCPTLAEQGVTSRGCVVELSRSGGNSGPGSTKKELL